MIDLHTHTTASDGLFPPPALIARAVEARHSDHDPATEAHYRQLAAQHGLGVSGGSDFHGDRGHHATGLGIVTLPAQDFAALQERVA